uniref:DUF4283 domain-containing protein n=1 Tax=Nicotiana tabacum TaxID=4097 RepID=A0A1S3ZT15_TOBAC|nr:PREDICTED: uncharacterized protein LOC107790116 [Nicotiana tabacum]
MDHQQEDAMQDLYESPNSKNEGEQLASGVKALQLSNDEKDRLYSTWKYSLIIKLFGKRIMHHYLKVKIQELWKSIKQFPLIDLRSDYFIVKFTKEENMNNVLRNGPWFVNGHFLSVIKWQPNFVAGKAQQTNTIVWKRLPQLPTEYYDGALLKCIGNSIGTLLKIDACTSSTLRGQYARLCTQVPLEEPVTTCIQIDSHLQQIIYEGEVFLCKYYGRMGHTAIRCLHRQRGKRPIPESTQDGQEIAQDSSTLHKQQMVKDNSSEWQTVSFAKRRRNTTNQKQRPREAVKEKKLQHSPGIGVSFTTKEQEQEDSKSATHSTTLIAYPSLSSHLASPSGQVDMQVDSPNLHAKIHTLNSPNPSLSKFHSIDTQSSALINLSHIPHNITPAFISQNVTPPSPTPLQNTFTPSTTSHQISNQPHEQLPPPLAHHQLGYATQPLPPFHPPQSWIEQGLQG